MRDKILLRIKRKKAEIESLRDQIGRIQGEIKQHESYLQALEDTLRLVDKNVVPGDETRSDVSLKEGSDLAKVRDVLKAAGHPLHIKEIMHKMGIPFSAKTRASLVGSIGQYARKGRVFVRAGKNIFGLLEMMKLGDAEPDSEDSEDELFDDVTHRRVHLIR